MCFFKKNMKNNFDKDGYYWNWEEINKMPLHSLSWKEFYDDYINNNQEYAFYYKDRIIDLSNSKGIFICSFVHQNLPLEQNKYNSPKELLEKSRFNGKSLKEIWNELK